MFKRLLLWIMLVALPLQSYAAAGMIYCAPNHHGMAGAAQTAKHDHAEHGADHMQHHGNMSNAGQQSDDQSTPHQTGSSTCSACSACCLGTALTTAVSSTVPLLSGSPVMVSRPINALASVTLEGLQRPPRSTCV